MIISAEQAILNYYAAGLPFPEIERRRYRRSGFTIHDTALMPALLPAIEWHADSFVATKGKEAHISVLHALEPGRGAWGRLFARLRLSQYRITVICPLGRFRGHLGDMGFSGPHPMPGGDCYCYPPREEARP